MVVLKTERLVLICEKDDYEELLPFRIYFNDVLVGRISIKKRNNIGEIHYETIKEHQRKGYMLESLRRIILYCEEVGLEPSAPIEPSNFASMGVAYKAGLTEEDEQHNYKKASGR